MQILNRLNVGSRLGLGFALILLLMGIMMFVSLNQMQRLQAELDKTAGEFRERLLLINRMRDSVRFQAIALRDVVSQEDIAFKKSELKLMREARKNYREASEQLEKHPEVAPQLQNIRPLEEAVAESVSQVMEATLSDDHLTAQAGIRDQVRPRQMKLIEALEAALQTIDADGQANVQKARQSYEKTRTLLLSLSATALILGLAVAWLITRSIVGPLGNAVRWAQRIAGGDLSARIQIEGKDELTQLQQSLDEMVNQLSSLIQQVSLAIDATLHATQNLASNAAHGVALAGETSERINAVNAAMHSMNDGIEQVADSARMVATAAADTQEIVNRGNRNVSEGDIAIDSVVKSMNSYSETLNSLNQRIGEISAITTVIREIADQTNLLALNAAIEAARAGESGRGFAVVADEVRKLAERTASSTESIASKVRSVSESASAVVKAMDGIHHTVNHSASLSHQTHEIFSEILLATDRVVQETQRIGKAAGTQEYASQATREAVARIESLAEGESASMRQIDVSVNQLHEASGKLKQLISRFHMS